MFTAKNITKKCAFLRTEFKVSPVKTGNQKVNPAKIAKTAPILST
jgi:hypothetical protein